MPERSGQGLGEAADRNDRFDGESVRRILERAAVEQHRLNNEQTDSYSLEELEEMAAEARISPEALRAALQAYRSQSPVATGRTAIVSDERPGTWLAALQNRMPERWSPRVKRVALTAAGTIALFGLLLTLPAIAHVLFWATLLSLIVLSVLLVLGASPF